MGFLIMGCALLAGFGLASLWHGRGMIAGAATSARGSAPVAGAKAQVGDVVASFPQAAWGTVQRVTRDADGFCYDVGFCDGDVVTLRELEITR